MEVLVRRVEHLLAPTVEDADLEVGNHALNPLRQAEHIVQTVALGGCDGIGKPQLEIAALHRVSRCGAAAALHGRDAVHPGLRHRDVRHLLARAPLVVRHRRHHRQLRRHPLAEILRQGDDLQRRVDDRQVEGDRAVTAHHAGKRPRIVARFRVRLPVPHIFLACRLRDFRDFRGIDCQMQRHHTVAARHVRKRPRVVARFGVGRPAPRERVARRLVQLRGIQPQHGKLHRHHAVAARHRLQGDRLRVRTNEGNPVPQVRELVRADTPRLHLLVGAGNGQRHRDRGVTAADGLIRDTLRARTAERHPVPHVW